MPKKISEDQLEVVHEEPIQEFSIPKDVETKSVKNRGGQRLELDVNGKVIVIMPSQTIKLPKDFSIPQGIGLFELL